MYVHTYVSTHRDTGDVEIRCDRSAFYVCGKRRSSSCRVFMRPGTRLRKIVGSCCGIIARNASNTLAVAAATAAAAATMTKFYIIFWQRGPRFHIVYVYIVIGKYTRVEH